MFDIGFDFLFLFPVSSWAKKRCLGVCQCAGWSPAGSALRREFGKQLVAMAAVCCPPISSRFTRGVQRRGWDWGGGRWVDGWGESCTVWHIAAIWGGWGGRLAYIEPGTVNPCSNSEVPVGMALICCYYCCYCLVSCLTENNGLHILSELRFIGIFNQRQIVGFGEWFGGLMWHRGWIRATAIDAWIIQPLTDSSVFPW